MFFPARVDGGTPSGWGIEYAPHPYVSYEAPKRVSRWQRVDDVGIRRPPVHSEQSRLKRPVRPVFVQPVFVQPAFVQLFSSNPIRLG